MEKEIFIQKARKLHGDKYLYDNIPSKVLYSDRVEIICRKHGVFFQNAGTHITKSGCPYCCGKMKKNTEQFIREAKLVHGDKYDYSITNYKTALEKVDIICPKHGVFTQEASSHLRGCGCPKCARIVIDRTEDFIRQAKKAYKDEYTYERTQYVNSKTKVVVTHKEVGDVLVYPLTFLKGEMKENSFDLLEDEEWRDVVGLEQYYQVSNKGRVRSKDRKSKANQNGERVYKGRIIKGHTTKLGYIRMVLKMRPKSVVVFLHRLVAQAFLPNEEHLPFVNHKDENPSNNCVENLEWCTQEYNSTYGTAVQRAKITKAKNGVSITVEKVDKSGSVVDKYLSLCEAAEENNVSHDRIAYAIKHNKEIDGYSYRKANYE